jgi:diguanylate cyclase (GGDEF)-like protein/PAS domain S-box-containing protein
MAGPSGPAIDGGRREDQLGAVVRRLGAALAVALACAAILSVAGLCSGRWATWIGWPLVVLGWAMMLTCRAAATRLRHEAARATKEVRAVARASGLGLNLDLQHTLNGIVEAVRELLVPHACVIYLLQPGTDELRPSYMYFDPSRYDPTQERAVRSYSARFGSGLVGSVTAEGRPVLLRDVLKDPRAVPIPGARGRGGTYIIVPLTVSGSTLGAMRISRDENDKYDDDDLALATILGSQAAYAIANARLYELSQASEHQALLSEARYERLTRHAGEAIISISAGGHRLTHLNRAMEETLGYCAAELQQLGLGPSELVAPESLPALLEALAALRAGAAEVKEARLAWVARGGRLILLEHTFLPVRDESGELQGVESIARDVTERERMESEIRKLTYHDQLTGVHNRAYFERELRRLAAVGSGKLTLVMGDLNGLKLANDAFGHAVGDRLLVDTAAALRGVLRRSDVICRWGGDEFAMLLPGVDEAGALLVITRIRSALAAVQPNPIPLSIALGVATATLNGQPVAELVHAAEERMYRNKLLESRATHNAIVTSLQRTLWAKTHETEEHAHRLQRMAAQLGRRLGLRDDALASLSLLAMLHDVGKVAIPASVLGNPGALCPEEWEIMRRHPEIGYRLAAACPNLAPIAGLILSHHERWDGQGYPRGLAGEAIPLAARIFAVADAFDVMTHGRPYRPAIRRNEALAELERCSGAQFDPQVVRAARFVVLAEDEELRPVAG